MKQNHSSSFSFISNNIISLLSGRKKASISQKASFGCFLRKQGYHVTNLARKTSVTLQMLALKKKLSRLLAQRINEFKMNEIQRKSPQ